MPTQVESAESMLQAAYKDLGFADGLLLDATDDATQVADDVVWLDKGDWLRLANTVKAEKVFFVGDNPVIVFAQHDTQNPEELRNFFNKIWCMSRPQLLFLASPGELNVLDMTAPPVRLNESVLAKPRVLDTAKKAADVLSELGAYRREQIESGKLFEEARFEKGEHRADGKLIDDLRRVREQLISAGLKAKHVHALIGRSIFIRYLEDRGVLTRDFFDRVARSSDDWIKALNTPSDQTYIDPRMSELLYPRVLSDKDFTYALFEHLSERFNGDMFPADPEEKHLVEGKHLNLLRDFLTGAVDDSQRLFFFAYRFDIIPIELISSIYEEFYNRETDKKHNQGSHYTPGSLVEYVLGQVLTPDCLATNPRILDPACGSGIFLVETFRRIVRFRVKQQGRRLNLRELRQILRDQIAGIDINQEAIRVAAFSLYLALLHYQEPPDILQHPRLPNMVYQCRQERDENQHFDILLDKNAFDVDYIAADEYLQNRFGTACTDIVVGNPPWGDPKDKDDEEKRESKIVIDWCNRKKLSIGTKERSQAFLHRTVDLLRDGGRAGLLVSTGVFFKEGHQSHKFRQQLLSSVTLVNVTSFVHVRDVFFRGTDRGADGTAPFASVFFMNVSPKSSDHRFQYWSAKRTAAAVRLRSVVLSHSDLKLVSQYDAVSNDDTWKIFWWGSHRDEALIRSLGSYPKLNELVVDGRKIEVTRGQGFQRCPNQPQQPALWLQDYGELPLNRFQRYGRLDLTGLGPTPSTVKRRGKQAIYEGTRLLFKRGVGKTPIVARLETKPFCFTNAIQGVRIDESFIDEAKVLLGIYWSSLAKYYFWMTCGSWGTWHDEIHKDIILTLPVCIPSDCDLKQRIVRVVDELRSWDTSSFDLGGNNKARISAKERELDEAIFDLYKLNPAERDLVMDMCQVGLDLFYRHVKSDAMKQVAPDRPSGRCGLATDLPTERTANDGLEAYIGVFLQTWNRELGTKGEFRWQVIRPSCSSPMLAVIFSTQFKDTPLPLPSQSDSQEWEDTMRRIDANSLQPYGSKRVYIDGLVRIVTDTDIVIIKRNEQRLWTRSMAREDAEATLLQAMFLQGSETRG